MNIAIMGGGLAGCSISYFLKKEYENKVQITIFEKEDEMGGLCRTKKMENLLYEHGPHILYTKNYEMQQFFENIIDTIPVEIRVGTFVDNQILDYPVSIRNILKLKEVIQIIDELYHCNPLQIDSTNFETYMISLMGTTLYKKFIYGYTKKMWGVDPSELTASWAPNRISFRKDDYRLFQDDWQAYPVGGYTNLFKKLSSNCEVVLNKKITPNVFKLLKKNYDFIFNTLPIDEIYNFSEGKLKYRGLELELEVIDKEDFLPDKLAWLNYPNTENFLRICEYKHINQIENKKTLISREFPTDQLRHYPVYTKREMEIFKSYLKKISHEKNVITSGRLGLFLYLPMDKCIEISKKIVQFYKFYKNMNPNTRYEKYLEILKIYNKF